MERGDPDDDEDPKKCYLLFTQPLTMLYKELYNVPSGTVYWRGKLEENGDVLAGTAVSEIQPNILHPRNLIGWFMGTKFQYEGNFTAEFVTDETTDLPEPVNLELIDMPDLSQLSKLGGLPEPMSLTPPGEDDYTPPQRRKRQRKLSKVPSSSSSDDDAPKGFGPTSSS